MYTSRPTELDTRMQTQAIVGIHTRSGMSGAPGAPRASSGTYAIACAALAIALAAGCEQTTSAVDSSTRFEVQATEGATPWTSLEPNDAAEDFSFVIVSDRTGGARPGVFPSAIPKVNLLEPAFVVSVGDLIEGYTEDQAQLDGEWNEFEGFIEDFEVPFFYAPGNHDMSNATMAETWQVRFGPSFYRFVYKDVLFLVLNSELFGMVHKPDTPVPGPWTQDEQLAFIERTLVEVPEPRWTIVIVHQPLWDYDGAGRGDWPKVEAMLAGREHTVFAGHFHRYVKVVRQDSNYITLATTGGGSSLRGSRYGEFDHVAQVSMTANGPRIANLMLDGIHDEDIVTEDVRDTMRWLQDAVQSVPMVADDKTFLAGSASFRVANGGDTDLAVALHVDPGPDLRYARASENTTIPAAGERLFTFDLTAAEPLPYHEIRPGRVFWSLSTHTGRNPVDLDVVSALLPVAKLPIPSGEAPTVDGDLTDWGSLPYRADRQRDIASPPTAPTDIAYAFGVRESGGDLYLAVRVSDDSLLSDRARDPMTQDSVMIAVDARPDPERSANLDFSQSTRGDLLQMAVAFVTLEGFHEESYYLRKLEGSRAAVAFKAVATEAGYDVELKVDGAFLDQRAEGTWDTLRLAIAASDWDAADGDNHIPWHTKGSDGIALHWLSNRFGEAPVAGSGTFARSVD